MDDEVLRDSIINHLQQAHAAERAQVGELRTLAVEMTVPVIATALRAHAEETTRHADRIEARLSELGEGSSMRLLAQNFGATIPRSIVDRLRPNDPCAGLRDAIAAEAGEIATFLLLEAEAIRAGDESTAVLTAELRAEELATRDELMTFWPHAVDEQVVALVRRAGDLSATRVVRDLLVDKLQDVQALERNASIMLTTVLATIDDELARERVEEHRTVTARQGDALVHRLRSLGSRPSLRKQAQGYAFAAIKGPVNLARTERAAKDMRDMYVAEHLELIGYRQLEILAERCGDDTTRELARALHAEERAMATWLEREAGRFLLESLERRA